MNIYIYTNIIGNACTGDYYFIAANRGRAGMMANRFASSHNERINNNSNYTIEWESIREVKEYPIIPGFLPLNRITLAMKI